jgi:hypothetical protein
MFVLIVVRSLYENTQEQNSGKENGFTISIRVLQMVRIVLFPRNLRHLTNSRDIRRFKRMMRRVFRKLYTLGIVFLCVGYVFASLGTLCFGGLINRSPDNNPYYEELMASAFGKSGFWALNFNDFMSSCFTLFSCLHTSDFDVISTGFTSTTSDWSRLYFLAWYVIGVLLMLNIIKSFFLGEFLTVIANRKMVSPADNHSHTTTAAHKNLNDTHDDLTNPALGEEPRSVETIHITIASPDSISQASCIESSGSPTNSSGSSITNSGATQTIINPLLVGSTHSGTHNDVTTIPQINNSR